jgi:hypothetical protein
MRRTLQHLLLVAAVASAPLTAAAAPSNDAPRHEPRSFFSMIMDRLKEVSQPPAPVEQKADVKSPMPRLPRWISEILDLDDASRSTGT